MIKANELRRGNLFDGMGMTQTVFEIIDNTNRGEIKVLKEQPTGRHPAYFVSEQHKERYEVVVTVLENKNQYKPCEMNGIILTEDWLRKLGFEFNDGTFHFVCNSGDTDCKLQYVHQLQNLYICITGNELTIIQ